MTPADALLAPLDSWNDRLDRLRFADPVSAVYNPHRYARGPWEQYLRRFGADRRRVLFLGMNPGPWGMAQTGIPFGEVHAAAGWMGLDAPVDSPPSPHPKRPVEGWDCPRSEVSGRRLWGLFADRFGTPERFFADHLVLNYCPLVFMAESGRNITPDKLPAAERDALFTICDEMLLAAVRAYRPAFLVGIGAFARRRLEASGAANVGAGPEGAARVEQARVVQILHPSPASPAANRGWAEQAERQLRDAGVW